MDIDSIKKKIVAGVVRPIDVKDRSAVMIPLIRIDGEYHLVYERRSKKMRKDPYGVSFPGGGWEESDMDFQYTALRETMEELNLSRDNIRVLGEIDYLIGHGGSTIRCYVGEIVEIALEEIKANEDEVDHIFTIPLKFLMENEPRVYKVLEKRIFPEDFPFHLIPQGEEYRWGESYSKIHFYKYGDYVVWGYTAKITKRFIDILKRA